MLPTSFACFRLITSAQENLGISSPRGLSNYLVYAPEGEKNTEVFKWPHISQSLRDILPDVFYYKICCVWGRWVLAFSFNNFCSLKLAFLRCATYFIIELAARGVGRFKWFSFRFSARGGSPTSDLPTYK
ncbi:hypothetical protein TSAR_006019 [Trichomalopsis sarcophagae]|uniref:Uncharacterized protein n=1 Tax=Trichomalopsis sarcophagae TaxID=543379 RepID=A0A232EEK3_9HYME|nr:hypothetical protein TSAR_006019 [Trichomalopsis sarcophagae]